ncbi:MAG: helicase C-terminal domain-containing protein [Nitrosarchaeum sp.]|nr:helicase C-terminal domain-containing protein [Nitrosarchaeum sp.]
MNPRFDNKQIVDFFPFPNYRTFQRETIEEVQGHLLNNVKDIILEMPTGSGKSPVAISTGIWSENAYCLTSQKILQDQYIRDFEENMQVSVLKGRGNYECTFLGSPTMCNECYEPARKECYRNGTCLYQNAKRRTASATIALMNYCYFLNVIDCDPSQVFKPRKLLICDEAHCLESELMSQIEFVLSEFVFKRMNYPVTVPTYETLQEYAAWIQENIDAIGKILNNKSGQLKSMNQYRVNLSKDSAEFLRLAGESAELASEVEDIDRLFRRMKTFLETLSHVEWIFTVEKTEKLKFKRVVFRPLTVDQFANAALLCYGTQRLYMSATILDKKSFCKSLGLNFEEAVFIRVSSTFPPENRKIYFTKTGYMNMANIDETLPKIVTDVNKALDYHKAEKGLIHCHSYKIANFIEQNCYNPRLIFHDSTNREVMLSKFMTSKEPMVIVSPSMTEGLDLKDDLARWEIIVKIPYLYIGDKQTARRMKVDPDWYNWQTCLTLVQCYGRIFRSETDWGTAYIFDSGARSFIQKNKAILPEWFLEACQF